MWGAWQRLTGEVIWHQAWGGTVTRKLAPTPKAFSCMGKSNQEIKFPKTAWNRNSG